MSTTPQRLTREEVARIEIGATDISARGAKWLVFGFFAIFVWVAPLQVILDLRDPPGRVQALTFLRALRQAPVAFTEAEGSAWSRSFALNRFLLREINEYEDRLTKGSFLDELLLPPMQLMLAGLVGVGNEQAYLGRDGWLFFRPGVDSLTGPGFLDPRRLRRRAAAGNEWQDPVHPDPVPAILDFRDQLAARGIRLVLVPVPVKPTMHPEQLARHYEGRAEPLHNASYGAFMQRMEEEGIVVFDTAPFLAHATPSEEAARYLRTDTHWRPESMERVSEGLAEVVRIVGRLDAGETEFQERPVNVVASGDIARMLRLPEGQRLFPPEAVTVRQVLDAQGSAWRADVEAEVLLLGDSFSNIYADERMGWGRAAGLAERMSLHLRQPVDTIIRNDAGAVATRRILAQQLRVGTDRLAGKKVVVWQFAARELAVGNWAPVDLTLGPAERPAERRFLAVPMGEERVAEGRVVEATPVPTPGSVPYKDHIRSLHIVDLRSPDGVVSGEEALVYVWSMRDNRWTPAAGLGVGDRVTLRLRAWDEVAGELEAINRSEVRDLDLQLQEPLWGEWR